MTNPNLSPSSSLRCGIDLGGTKTEIVVLSREGGIRFQRRVPTPAAEGYAAIVHSIAALVEAARCEVQQEFTIGIGAPGSVSPRTGTIRNANTQCLNGMPLLDDLADSLPYPMKLENDANCFAVSEATDGAAAGHRIVFGVILGTGCGGGLVVDGNVHRGANGIGGEWGHAVLDPMGPPCYCGNRGCNEMFLSGPPLTARYHACTGETLRPTEIAMRAASGEPKAANVYEQYLEHFGRALANLLNTLDPDIVVVGGGLSRLEALYDRGRAYAARYLFSDAFTTPLVKSAHGDASGVRGAAMLWPWHPAEASAS